MWLKPQRRQHTRTVGVSDWGRRELEQLLRDTLNRRPRTRTPLSPLRRALSANGPRSSAQSLRPKKKSAGNHRRGRCVGEVLWWNINRKALLCEHKWSNFHARVLTTERRGDGLGPQTEVPVLHPEKQDNMSKVRYQTHRQNKKKEGSGCFVASWCGWCLRLQETLWDVSREGAQVKSQSAAADRWMKPLSLGGNAWTDGATRASNVPLQDSLATRSTSAECPSDMQPYLCRTLIHSILFDVTFLVLLTQ